MSDTLTAADLDELEQKCEYSSKLSVTAVVVELLTLRALLALARKGLECDEDRKTYLRVLSGMSGERDALAAELAELQDAVVEGGLGDGSPAQPVHAKALNERVDMLRVERDKLQAFKDWVHAYLDSKGVPHHPPGVHGAEGCRIGDRMDWVWAERERVAVLADWIIRKLKTMTEYYKPPTDGRDIVSEIQGWMHVLCFHYVQNRREVREYDAARKEAKQFQAELAAANARADAATQAERERCAKIVDMECNIQKSLVDDSDDDWKKKACKHAAVIAEIIHQRIRAGGQP